MLECCAFTSGSRKGSRPGQNPPPPSPPRRTRREWQYKLAPPPQKKKNTEAKTKRIEEKQRDFDAFVAKNAKFRACGAIISHSPIFVEVRTLRWHS